VKTPDKKKHCEYRKPNYSGMCFGRLCLYVWYMAVRSAGVIYHLLDQEVGVGRAVSKKFGCNSVDDNWDGLKVYSVVQVGSGSASGMITDDLVPF